MPGELLLNAGTVLGSPDSWAKIPKHKSVLRQISAAVLSDPGREGAASAESMAFCGMLSTALEPNGA